MSGMPTATPLRRTLLSHCDDVPANDGEASMR